MSGRSVDDLVADVDRSADLGANVVKVPLYWSWLEPESGSFDPRNAAKLDAVVEAARDRGLGVILTPVLTPCSVSTAPIGPGGGCDPTAVLYPPRSSGVYADFVRRAVDRWGADVSGIEVWNEPNHQGFWRGSPGEYLGLVRAAAEGVRASRYADIPVVGGALSGADLTYLRQLLDGGLADWTDAVSIHPYDVRWQGPGWGDPSIVRQDDMTSFAFAVPEVRRLMDAFGDSDPIWITEFGYPDCPATPYCVRAADQADYLKKAAELAASWSYVDAFIVYRLRDWLPQDGGIEGRFGVLNKDGSPKPAARSLGRVFTRLTR
jgi:hypothetical protein